MNKNEKLLASLMLNIASNEFSNHGCNDVENSVYKNWTPEEKNKFVKEFHEWNGDPEETDDYFLNNDNMLMSFLAYKLTLD